MLPRNMELQLIGSYLGYGGTYKDAVKQKSTVIEQALLMNNNASFEYSINKFDKDLNEAAGT
jgi:hypothetical protein